MSKWDELSLTDKADIIGIAVKNGITTLPEIRAKYNEFAEGGDTNPGMTGMMKSKLATTAHYGNPTARRMTNYDTRSYIWPNEYEYINGIGEPKRGNVFVSSYDNLVTPQIQDNGKSLEFVEDVWSPENDNRSYMQSIKFDNPYDAQYFGEHYKEVAPMMNLYSKGGRIHIAPSKKGTFTAAASKHGMGVQEFASRVLAHPENYSPAMRKKANFARNAKKFKHGEGGNLFAGGGSVFGLLPAMPGVIFSNAIDEAKNTKYGNMATAGAKALVNYAKDIVTGTPDAERNAGLTYLRNLNRENQQDALDVMMHSTDGAEVMSGDQMLRVGIPNYLRHLAGQPINVTYTGNTTSDYGANKNRDLVNLYLKRDTTGFEDVTDNVFYHNGPDYKRYFEQYYPGISPRTYKMSSDGVPLELTQEEIDFANSHLNRSTTASDFWTEGGDNVGHYNRWYKNIDGKLYAIDSDVWDFNPKDWRWEGDDNTIVDKAGIPFILKAIRPVKLKQSKKENKHASGGLLELASTWVSEGRIKR